MIQGEEFAEEQMKNKTIRHLHVMHCTICAYNWNTSVRSLTRDHTFYRNCIPSDSEPRLHQLPPSRLMHAPVPHT
jgi:hypothetical protein